MNFAISQKSSQLQVHCVDEFINNPKSLLLLKPEVGESIGSREHKIGNINVFTTNPDFTSGSGSTEPTET